MSTELAAETLLNAGKFYTAIEIARIFGQSTQHGKRYMNNLINNPRFVVEQKDLAEPQIKVISIDGRKQSIDKLQNSALLFARPKSLIGEM
mgnify:CR=1 FL=1|tara:strand:- start:10168 stop:10440 length:273 start_codon:yes stop_codon:yes gene_type:complete